MLQSVKAYQREMDTYSDQAQSLTQTTAEPRVVSYVSQLTSRYQTLLNAVKVTGTVKKTTHVPPFLLSGFVEGLVICTVMGLDAKLHMSLGFCAFLVYSNRTC